MSSNLKIIVIGGGAGGLCLAQGLKKAGIGVEVYERDAAPTSRMAGYRLSISPSGAQALRACLPADLYAQFALESGRPIRRVSFVDHHLKTLLAFDLRDIDRASPTAERPIARAALRRLLLAGLGEIVHFGKRLVSCETTSDQRAVAHFDDGTSVGADLIVGADGANSRTRAALLPGHARNDLGILAFGGKIPLGNVSRDLIPAPVLLGPTLAMGPRGRFMFASALEYEDLVNQAPREEYAMWGVSAPRAQLGIADPTSLDPPALRAAARAIVADWDPSLRGLVEAADLGSLTTFPIRAAVEVKPWPTQRITLLGDALHNMPPYRGVGANVALWDAALLTDTLARVSQRRAPLLAALGDYERAIVANGFPAVRRSVAAARRFHSESAIGYFVAKTIFRAIGFAAPLREAALGGR